MTCNQQMLLAFGDIQRGIAFGVASVSSGSVESGGDIVHTITLDAASGGARKFFVEIDGVAGVPDDIEVPVSADLSNGCTFVAGKLNVPAGVTSFTLTIRTVEDTDEDEEEYTLTVGNASGTGTITPFIPDDVEGPGGLFPGDEGLGMPPGGGEGEGAFYIADFFDGTASNEAQVQAYPPTVFYNPENDIHTYQRTGASSDPATDPEDVWTIGSGVLTLENAGGGTINLHPHCANGFGPRFNSVRMFLRFTNVSGVNPQIVVGCDGATAVGGDNAWSWRLLITSATTYLSWNSTSGGFASDSWTTTMAGLADKDLRLEIGAAGSHLLYADGALVHTFSVTPTSSPSPTQDPDIGGAALLAFFSDTDAGHAEIDYWGVYSPSQIEHLRFWETFPDDAPYTYDPPTAGTYLHIDDNEMNCNTFTGTPIQVAGRDIPASIVTRVEFEVNITTSVANDDAGVLGLYDGATPRSTFIPWRETAQDSLNRCQTLVAGTSTLIGSAALPIGEWLRVEMTYIDGSGNSLLNVWDESGDPLLVDEPLLGDPDAGLTVNRLRFGLDSGTGTHPCRYREVKVYGFEP